MTEPPLVVVHDVGVDAIVMDGVLILRPGQTFESAVAAVGGVRPDLHPDDIRALVREHLPDAPGLESDPRWVAVPVPTSRPPARWPRLVISGLGLSLAGAFLIAGWSLAVQLGNANGEPGLALDGFTEATGMDCRASGNAASCVDVDGTRMVGELQGNILTLVWRDQWAAVRFSDAEADIRAVSHPNPKGPLPISVETGRWTMWGTDPSRVMDWVGRIETHEGRG